MCIPAAQLAAASPSWWQSLAIAWMRAAHRCSESLQAALASELLGRRHGSGGRLASPCDRLGRRSLRSRVGRRGRRSSNELLLKLLATACGHGRPAARASRHAQAGPAHRARKGQYKKRRGSMPQLGKNAHVLKDQSSVENVGGCNHPCFYTAPYGFYTAP